ncbi:MAG: hypothetical protein ACI8YQ_003976 [Polaribacter sp.]
MTESLGNSRALGFLYAVKIQIHSNHYSPRLLYATDFLFGQILDFNLIYSSDAPLEKPEEVLIIYYGTKRPTIAKFFIPAHPFLEQNNIDTLMVTVNESKGLPAFFYLPLVEGSDLSFDIFAMTFYLLSRFEEYSKTVQKDEHQRFPARASLAFKEGFLHQPLIDQWAWRLYDLLKSKFPNCPERKPTYEFLPTIDVDFAWAYLHKGWGRTTASFFKSLLTLNRKLLTRQLKVVLAQQKDPYDTFDFLLDCYEKHDVKALFFMLLGEYGAYDKNNPPEQISMQQLMKRLGEKAGLGIHPSYASNNSFSIFKKEKQLLEKAIGASVKMSRQHFLKISLPETYQQLLAAGIEKDYSMGYAAAIGFRASTAHPFYWYDLENERATELEIVPFAVMDVTLKNYLQLKPEEALSACAKIISQTRQTGGIFCLLWHNSSFSAEMGFEDWGGVYEKIVALAVEEGG